MSNFLHLFTGEIQRMKKYHILAASIVAALLWMGILHFIEIEDLTDLFPLFIFIDATSMSMLLIGVTMFFEKQEGVLKTLFVSPINKVEYILSKTFANITSNVLTLALLYAYAKIFKTVNVNIFVLLFAVILIAIFHSLFGFIITYYSKTFTDMLMGIMKYAFIFTLPVVLETVNILKGKFGDILSVILYFVPTKASMLLLQSSSGGIEVWEIIISIFYLILASGLIYLLVVKKFDEFAIKESGV